eukprot:TRINITY_DN2681_c0_g2_i11.p1 TRINITY_DN2681_c0_g2~~TRINITY_DN2681_c0_g2_i11.p1  ORF type:complete len:223 (-),score=42.81 TRINITY_DN2681_c0_g2_i11:112-780(-)
MPACDNYGYSNAAIRWASQCGHTAVVARLLQLPHVDPSASDSQALRWACKHGHTQIVDLLLQSQRVDPAACDNEALQNAVSGGHTAIAARLLQYPQVDPTANEYYCVIQASHYGHVDIMELLLRDARVVRFLQKPVEVIEQVEMRRVVAIAQCAAFDPFRSEIGDAYRLAYACVKGEAYSGMAESLCEWVLPGVLAWEVVRVQRQLAAAMQRLRACGDYLTH